MKCACDEYGDVLSASINGNGLRNTLYTNPPQRTWVGLTEQQIKSILSDNKCWVGDDCSMPNLMYIVRLVESTLREKNNGN